MMGGFFAVAWTDFVQAMLMFGTLVILPVVGYLELRSTGVALTVGETPWTFAAVVGGLSWGLGYFGQPHTLTRFMSMKNPDSVRVGRIIALAWAIPAFVGAIMIGLVAAKLYPTLNLPDSEQLMPHMATSLLPGWLAGVFISGAVAAMMSTADSQLLVGTSAVAEDFYRRGLKRELTPERLVMISRGVTVGLGVAGFLLAMFTEKLIFALVSYAWAGLGSSFGPALLACLYWKRTTAQGVLAGMITGGASTVIWSNVGALEGFVSVRAASFVLASIAVIVVSITTVAKTERPL
jgi:sodium/proline symporter